MIWQSMNDSYIKENLASVEQEYFKYFNRKTDKQNS